MKIPQHTLIMYLRKGHRKPYGVVVAVKRPEDGEISVDFSLCNNKKDRFTKARALEIAIGRAMSPKENDSARVLPRSLYKVMEKFNKRVAKYYKTSVDEMITW